MARETNKLSVKAVDAASYEARAYKMADGGGLTLYVQPTGKYWWFRYRYAGKEKTISFGPYPQTTLKQARQRRDDARKLLTDGVDPSAHRRAAKVARARAADNTFRAVAIEWYEDVHKREVVEAHATRNLRRLEVYAFPLLARRPVGEIEPPEILEVLRRIQRKGHLETAHRIKTVISKVFRYAVSTGRAQRDMTADLKGAIPPAKETHFPAITDPDELGHLLRAIDGYSGQPSTSAALRLSPILMARPGELRAARWDSIDFDAEEWHVTAKGGTPLMVPLPRQALAILEEMEPISGHREYVFPAARGADRPISNNTLNAALKRMDYGGRMTGHGFRATARTLLVERLGHPVEIVEMQLGHRVRDVHGRAYNRTQWLDDRRAMLQAWADYLDELRAE